MTGDVLAAQQGDLAAFERLVGRWQGAVCAIGLGILRDASASEDVAQEVFVAAWQGLGSLRDPASFGPWIRQLARNKALASRRSDVRRIRRVVADSEAVERAASDVDPVLAAEERRVVQEALDALPDDARDVMVLFYREGQSVRQVAELLGLSEAAVRKRLSRARAEVRADVLRRLDVLLRATAPGAAFTATVLAAVSPAPAAAAVSTGLAGGTAKGLLGGLGLGAAAGALGIFLGYGLAERVVPESRRPQLHRGRNLSVGGLALALLLGVVGAEAGLVVGVAAFVAILGYVQFRVLPRAFALPEGTVDRRSQRAARLGAAFGALGWGVGALCGLAGALHGWWS